jgi:hypothetical protein
MYPYTALKKKKNQKKKILSQPFFVESRKKIRERKEAE